MLFEKGHNEPKDGALNLYLEGILVLRQLQRFFLSTIQALLAEEGLHALNPTQALLVYHIGPQTIKVHEVLTRGFYGGCNPSYNLRKLMSSGYVLTQVNPKDKRGVLLSLSESGMRLHDMLVRVFAHHQEVLELQGLGPKRWQQWLQDIEQLKMFWASPYAQAWRREPESGKPMTRRAAALAGLKADNVALRQRD
jgi:DNA-binding MarR family transcriptional regulator